MLGIGMIAPIIKTLPNDTLKGFAVNLVQGFKEFIQKKTTEANTTNDYGIFSMIQNDKLIILPIEITSSGEVQPHTKELIVIDDYLNKINYKKAAGLIMADMDDASGLTVLEALQQSITETPTE